MATKHPKLLKVMAAFAVSVSMLISLSGCLEPEGSVPDITGFSYGDFSADMEKSMPDEAVDCGRLRVGADRSEANCCVASNFASFTPFHVTYDSDEGGLMRSVGIMRDDRGVVTKMFYTADVNSRQRMDNGSMDKMVCLFPKVAENTCSDPVNMAISCNNDRAGW